MRGWSQVAGKPLKGFGDAGVLEVVADFDGNTFRTVYTVRFAKAVYVLHAFQSSAHEARGAGHLRTTYFVRVSRPPFWIQRTGQKRTAANDASPHTV
jgi:hypothetical protein